MNGIVIFTEVLKAQSFSQAAINLKVTKSTISKKVTELERELGVTLLRRTTRSLQVTEMGQHFYDQCAKALSEINEATDFARSSGAEPRGHLRVTAPGDFASQTLAPLLAAFLDQYPRINLEMILSDHTLDLTKDNIDVAIRLGPLPDSSFRAKKIGRDVFQLIASPTYLKTAPPLKQPSDLKNHRCLVFAPKPEMRIWNLKSASSRFKIEPPTRFIANHVSAAKSLVLAHSGISLMPVSNCLKELANKDLQIVLPEWSMEDAPIHLVFQKHLFVSPKTRVFVDYLEVNLKPLFA